MDRIYKTKEHERTATAVAQLRRNECRQKVQDLANDLRWEQVSYPNCVTAVYNCQKPG